MKRRHEKPLKRRNPSGRIVWVARYTGRDGKTRSAGTFELKRDAQAAIDDAYDREEVTVGSRATVGYYAAETWLEEHPRTERTAMVYAQRLRAILDVPVHGTKVRDWRMADFRRGQAVALLDYMLRKQGRAAKGAKGILLTLSAMYSDAIDDEVVEHNPFLGMRVRASDPRVQKPARKAVVASWEQMHAFAAACGPWEPMVRVLADCGLRLGELFALERADVDGEWLQVRRSAWRGSVQQGTKTDHGEADAGRRVPVPPELLEMLEAVPRRIDTRLLFPSPSGRVWGDRRFYDVVWYPAREATGLGLRPHDMRHSYVSLMRAAGVDPAALASWTGHTVLTATSVYTHATGSPAMVDLARRAVG